MKGTRQMPQCGFSAQVVQILDKLVPSYETIDVLRSGRVNAFETIGNISGVSVNITPLLRPRSRCSRRWRRPARVRARRW
ncbi:MAG: glutaredoxin domain-containing protein [Acidobacteria bacterium]|nr:glutaredoxin domain-containing protein [Acidobacteriota bacterium]